MTQDLPDTEDNILGVQWRGTGSVCTSDAPSGSSARRAEALPHRYALKKVCGIGLMACNPECGGAFKRAFDYMGGWLRKPGRF